MKEIGRTESVLRDDDDDVTPCLIDTVMLSSFSSLIDPGLFAHT